MLGYRVRSRLQGVLKRPFVRRGTHSVEFAIVSMVFFLIVLGLIEMCRVLMVCHMLHEASRRGCRAAVIEGTSNTDAQTAIDNYLHGNYVNGYSMTVLVNDAVANANTANADDEVTVQISVPISSITWIPGQTYFFSGTVTEQYTLRRE